MQSKHLIRFLAAILLSTSVTCHLISYWNARLQRSTITRIIFDISLRQCMEECARIQQCMSVSYERVVHKCRLGDGLVTLAEGECRVCPRNVVVLKEDFPAEMTSKAIVPVVSNVYCSSWDKVRYYEGFMSLSDPNSFNYVPAFEMESDTGCTFDHNVGGASIAVRCAGTDKMAIYTKQPNGEISSHLHVFRSFSGNGFDPYKSWMFSVNIRQLEACVYMKTCYNNYRHPYLDRWSSLAIKQVRVSLRRNKQEVAFVLFDGENSDLENWFHPSRVIDSSWSEMTPQSTFHIFSLKGDERVVRRFFISSFYKSCEDDEIYISVAKRDNYSSYGCKWEIYDTKPQFMFSANTGPDVGRALHLADTLDVVLLF